MPRPGVPMSEDQKAKIRATAQARGRTPTKRCPKCRGVKDRSEFGVRSNGHSRAECRSCELAKTKAWQKQNPDKVRAYNRRTTLRRYFGITEEQYDALLAEQGGVCVICGEAETTKNGFLYVDHCHATGRIRGLLCGLCNTGLGMFRDNPDLLRLAITYLEKPVPAGALHAKPVGAGRASH
jgi:hypothetical protein